MRKDEEIMENQRLDFGEIVRKIAEDKMLLPDFQRGFVWTDEETQRKIVASVLAKMPIGSILLLKSKPDEYAAKSIGLGEKNTDLNIADGEVEFLLDGQQRMTVLTNVFSNVIYDKCSMFSKLISQSLKRRFFLRIPKWEKCKEEQVLFGVYDLNFRISDSVEPDFLTADILQFIEVVGFLHHDGEPYNPQQELSTHLDDYCLTYKKGYLVPLYLLIAPENTKRAQIMLRYNTITAEIAEKIGNEIKQHFMKLTEKQQKDDFIEEIFKNDESCEKIKEDYTIFCRKIDEKQMVWKMCLTNYLDSCVKNVALNKIEVSGEQRDRAIDIYENLNRGGVSLNTFDLVMARVAKVSKENFYKRMCFYIQEEKNYDKQVLPDQAVSIIGDKIQSKKYNASCSTGCYNEEKNDIAGKYIDVFLDVLCLYCNNQLFDPEEYKLDYIKKKRILMLEPEEIDSNAKKVCDAIDRAMFFFQGRCGIRNIQEINYSLMIVLVAVVFLKDEWFKDKTVHNILEAWYWASIFSGEYDKDQNTKMIAHLQTMIKTMQASDRKKNIEWIVKIKDYVMNAQNFSDEKFLLMEKADEERIPKKVMRMFMCQYLLSKTYKDMFEEDKVLSAYSDEPGGFEAHHIIPLGRVKKVGESTSALRNADKNICNSPLNFVYITKKANKEISDESLKDYVQKINAEAKSKLHITAYTRADIPENQVKDILKERYDFLKGDIKDRIGTLLN